MLPNTFEAHEKPPKGPFPLVSVPMRDYFVCSHQEWKDLGGEPFTPKPSTVKPDVNNGSPSLASSGGSDGADSWLTQNSTTNSESGGFFDRNLWLILGCIVGFLLLLSILVLGYVIIKRRRARMANLLVGKVQQPKPNKKRQSQDKKRSTPSSPKSVKASPTKSKQSGSSSNSPSIKTSRTKFTMDSKDSVKGSSSSQSGKNTLEKI